MIQNTGFWNEGLSTERIFWGVRYFGPHASACSWLDYIIFITVPEISDEWIRQVLPWLLIIIPVGFTKPQVLESWDHISVFFKARQALANVQPGIGKYLIGFKRCVTYRRALDFKSYTVDFAQVLSLSWQINLKNSFLKDWKPLESAKAPSISHSLWWFNAETTGCSIQFKQPGSCIIEETWNSLWCP